MELLPWFQKAVQLRLDEVSVQIEHDSKLSQIRGETDEAFEALFAGKDVVRMPEYAEWENRSIMSMGPDGESERSNTHKAQ